MPAHTKNRAPQSGADPSPKSSPAPSRRCACHAILLFVGHEAAAGTEPFRTAFLSPGPKPENSDEKSVRPRPAPHRYRQLRRGCRGTRRRGGPGCAGPEARAAPGSDPGPAERSRSSALIAAGVDPSLSKPPSGAAFFMRRPPDSRGGGSNAPRTAHRAKPTSTASRQVRQVEPPAGVLIIGRSRGQYLCLIAAML